MEIYENATRDVKIYKFYLEKISSIIHVSPKIGAVLYIVEWYIIYGIVYLISGSWIWGSKEFEIVELFPFFLTILIGWGLLYVKTSYINTSRKLKPLLNDGTYNQLFNKMMRKQVTLFIYILFAIIIIACAIYSFLSPDGVAYNYGVAGKLFIIHNCLWYLFIGGPVVSELISLIISVIFLPNLISKGIQDEAINPIEPYRCGGMRPIGELFLSGLLIYFLALTLYSVLFIQEVLIMSYLLYFMWGVGIFLFFIPQYSIKKLLSDYKKNKLIDITNSIHAEKKMNNLINGKTTEKNAITLFALMTLFTEIEKMHEYPFDLKILSDFLILSIIPLIINLIMVKYI